MISTIKKILYCLPVTVVLLLTVLIVTPAASAATLKTPSLNAPVNTTSGVKVSWGKVSGAQKYRVFVKTGSASWKKLADTTATAYYHKAAKSGTTYAYTVRCISKDGKKTTSDFNRAGKKITFVKAPVVASFVNTANGAQLKWAASKGAVKYRVDIKTSKGWAKLATVSGTAYLHTAAKNGSSYSYRLQAVNKSGKALSACGATKTNKYRYASYLNKEFAQAVYTAIGKDPVTPSAPNTTLTRQSAATILFKALGYKSRSTVKPADTLDSNLITIASYGYLIPDAANKIYPSRKITIDEYESIMADVNRYAMYHGKRMLAFGDEIMNGFANYGYGYGKLLAEKLGMSYISYAKNGATFSAASNGRFHICDQVKTAAAFDVRTDLILLNGGTNDMGLVAKNYATERFVTSKPSSSNFSKGFVYTMELIRKHFGSTPVIYVRDHNMAYVSDTLEKQMGTHGVTVARNHGAYIADVYSKHSAETLSARNRYTMYSASLKKGDSIHPNGVGYTAYYLPMISGKLTFAPTLAAPSNTSSGVKISWSCPSNAPKYRVFVKTGSSWVKLADTYAREYIHETAVSGTKYTYTVRGLSADGKQYITDYDTTGKSITYVAPPALTLESEPDGIRLNWDCPAGSAQYRVMLYRDATWIKLCDTTDNTYLYTTVENGASYTFTVRCLNNAQTAFTGAAANQKTLAYFDAPRITGVTNESDGARITWTPVEGAAKYRLYVREGDTWQTLADTASETYTHDAEHEAYYTYTVSCLDESGNVISAYYPEGYTHQYFIPALLETPQIKGAENLEEGLRVYWDPIEDAERYRVMRKNSNRWETLAEIETPYFLDTDVHSGQKETYTVCCVTAENNAYTSAYDTAGSRFTYFGAPEIRCQETASGLLLSWNMSNNAYGYRLSVRDGDDWRDLADTTENTYLYSEDNGSGDRCFTVCCIDDQKAQLGPYHKDGYTFDYHLDPDQPVYTAEQFSAEICRILGKAADQTTAQGAILNRRTASQILVKELRYPSHSKSVNFIDSDSADLKTTVFLGYFYPNSSDRIYPDALISPDEFESMQKEVERYTRLKGKQALAFGDSIMYGYGNNGYGSCRMICEKYGMQFINYSYCGATMGACNNGRVHIPDRIKTAHDAGYKADIIFLNGGTNDLSLIRKGQTPDSFDPAAPEKSTFSVGLESAFKMIRSYWGDTPVLYTRNHNMVVSSEELEQQLGEYGLMIAKRYNAHTVDIYTDTVLNTEIPEMRDRYTMYRDDLERSDGIHPDWLGYTTYYLPLENKAILSILLPTE